MLRTLLIFAAFAPAAIAAPVVEQDAIPGLPAVQVQDLHYGDVLFHFYQQDYFDSLVRLAAYRDQGRLVAHARDAELLRGGLYLSLGQHREAREIFERLLADASTPQPFATRPGSTSARCSMRPAFTRSPDRALRQSAGTLSVDVEAERHLLIAQGCLYRKRYDQAIAELSDWQGPRYWLLYGQFNLGVALVREGEAERGLALLDGVGQIQTQWPELMALRDKANLAIGYANLQAGEPAAARARARARATQRARCRARPCSARAGPTRRRSSTRPPWLPGRSCRPEPPRRRGPGILSRRAPTPMPSSARCRRPWSTTRKRSRPTTPSARASANRSARSAPATCSTRRSRRAMTAAAAGLPSSRRCPTRRSRATSTTCSPATNSRRASRTTGPSTGWRRTSPPGRTTSARMTTWSRRASRRSTRSSPPQTRGSRPWTSRRSTAAAMRCRRSSRRRSRPATSTRSPPRAEREQLGHAGRRAMPELAHHAGDREL